MRKSFAASVFAAFLLALCTGAAFAGNGHGNGNDAGGPPPQAQSHDQSSSEPVQSGGSNDHGVKPDSTTKHDTYARADSDKTKQYGNGKTAGKIATSRGATGDTVLHGPGNSQPHKVVSCGHTHEVDVHAVKSYSSDSCGEQKHAVAAVSHEQKHERKSVEHTVKKAVHEVEKQQPQHAAVAPATVEQKKVYICHATGSATNPYVLIHVSKHAEAAHTRHQDGRDIVLGETLTGSCPSAPPASAAVAPAQTQHTQAQNCTTQQQVQVVVGVKHFTGPKGSGRYVIIHPSTNSVHFDNKHPDELVYETRTVTVDAPCPTSTPAAAAAVQEQQATTTTTEVAAATAAPAAPAAGGVLPAQTAQSAPAATPAQGGVLGAQATIAPKTKPANGGVLGATGRIASSRLPFTGIELWIFALVAGALIAAGATLRRSGRGTL